ncbi:MAG: polysaccharide biosynthesis protein [Clostridiales bacterium]|nr:polysaccharide biosynthesis protein [Clostridiales bacterium]
MGGRKKQSLLNGALVLVIATSFVEIVGLLYKIPLTNLIGTVGRGYTGTAYNIYIPIYNISMAGLPVAISKLVSQSVAEGHFNDVKKIFKVAFRLFFATGVIGTIILLVLAYPYAKSIDSMESLPSIIMIAPAVFVCCVMATYRGYYSGLRNQTPSAISQMCEVVGKLVFGLGLAYAVQKYGLQCYEQGLAVFGVQCETRQDAIMALAPYAAAASIFGVTMGAVCSLVFLMLRNKIVGDKITQEELQSSPPSASGKKIAKTLITIAVPVVVSTLVMNITNLIDSWSIQYRLQAAIDGNLSVIENMYSEALSLAGEMTSTQLKSYIYGAYEIALDFRNLIPTITTTLGLSAIPVLSEAWTLKNKLMIRSSIESVIRVAMLIALPSGIGIAILSRQILNLVYGASSSASISATVMTLYGCFTFIMAAAQPLINMLQGIGRADIPMKSVSIAAVVKVAVNFILVGIPGINIYGAIIGTFCFYAITVSINLTSLIRVTGVKLNFKSVFFKPLFCAALCGVAAWAFTGLLSNILPDFTLNSRITTETVSAVIGIVIAVIVYALALLFTRSIAADDVKMLPKGEKICKILEKHGFIG